MNRQTIVVALIAVLTALGLTVRAQTDPNYLKALATVYAAGKTAQYVKDWCDARAPETQSITAKALTGWRAQYRLEAVEREFESVMDANRKAGVAASLMESRQKLFTQLDGGVKNPTQECQGFEADLAKNFNLRDLYPAELQLLDAQLPGGSALVPGPPTTKPVPVSPPTPNPAVGSSQKGVVYNVAQLNAVFEAARRKTNGDGSAKKKAGENAIRALGKRIYVTGTLNDDGRWLEFQNAKFTSERDVNCDNFRDENEDFPGKKSGGKPFTVLGEFVRYDVFLDFKDCQIVPSLAGLKTSTLDATLGLQRKALPPETFQVNPGAGLKDAQIYGIYLHQTSRAGVGGYFYIAYEPWLLLKDGSIYNDPVLAPNSFNAALSKRDEPQKWGSWTRQAKKFVIRWNEDSDGKPDTEDLTETKPGSGQQPLNGYFESLSGGGNTAYGGNTSIAAYSGYTFKPDGSFEFDRGAGSSSGNDYTGESANVAVSSTAATKKGVYKISGYNLELRFPDGKILRRSFCLAGDKADVTSLIYIGSSYYLKK